MCVCVRYTVPDDARKATRLAAASRQSTAHCSSSAASVAVNCEKHSRGLAVYHNRLLMCVGLFSTVCCAFELLANI